MSKVIAIDGPGGVGKTTLARGLADRLRWPHLDTGAFYRAATVVALICRTDLAIEVDVARVVAKSTLGFSDGIMTVDGVDCTSAIRSAVVTDAVSTVAAYPTVRRLLVDRQRAWVNDRRGAAVVEGRDIGTVVFPESPLKIYLTADAAVRAARRAGEISDASVSSVEDALNRRDSSDSTRRASPLAAADDAMVMDTSKLDASGVIEKVMALVKDRGLTP